MDYNSLKNLEDIDRVEAKAVSFYTSPRFVISIFATILLIVGCVFILIAAPKAKKSEVNLAHAGKKIEPPNSSQIVKPKKSQQVEKAVEKEPEPLIVTVRARDNLGKVFKRNGLSTKTAASILSYSKARVLKDLKPGKKINLTLDSTKKKVKKLTYQIDALDTLVMTSVYNGWRVKTNHIEPKVNTNYVALPIKTSIYASGKQAKIPNKLMAQLVNILSYKANVSRLNEGDRVAMFYNDYTLDGKKVRDSEIIAAELQHKGKKHRVIGFKDSSGAMNYYNPNGRSIKPEFNRYPINFRRVASRFSMNRKHPILGVRRPHTGVDLSAKRGTPIKATSNARVIFAGWKGGYGRAVILKNGPYSTLYAHMSGFAPKLRSGKYVNQGDVIGYVGSTGLSTSPHLHYEVRVKGVCHDPLSVRLPSSGVMIAAEHRGKFFALSKKMLAQLDLRNNGGGKILAMLSEFKSQ